MKTWMDFGLDVPLSASGEHLTTCPECSHTRKKSRVKCLSVNVEDEVFHCHHCGYSGTLREGRVKTDLHWRKPKYRKPEPKPLVDMPEKVVTWFQKRGINQQTLADFKINVASVYMPQIEDFTDAVVYPYYRNGELINAKYRDGKKNFRLEAGAERLLFNFDALQSGVVITEGEMDAMSVQQVGFPAVSVPDGAPSPESKSYESKFTFLEAAQEALDEANEVIIGVDTDEPGKRLEDELARRIGREKCKRVVWPDDCKDANETLVKHGEEKLRECIANAQPFPINGVFTVSDLSEKIFSLYENGWERGHSTGFVNLDHLYTVRPGEFTVVTGIPNSGKSNFLDAMTVKMARRHGWRFAVFSPENQPLEDHMGRLLEKYSGKPFTKGPTERMDERELGEAMEWLNAHYDFILPDEDADWTVETVLSKAKSLVFKHGIKGLIIDPWNELEQSNKDGESETNYISRELKRIRQFGRKYGVHIWVVAHPAKLYKNSNGDYPVPTPYDISGSAHWRNKADNCIAVWRDLSDTRNGRVEVHVQKIRFRQIGRLGVADFSYEPATGNYKGLAA